MDKTKKDILEKIVSKTPSKWFEESETRLNKKNERNAGRKKIENGVSRHIVATPEEFEQIKQLLKSIRCKD